MNLTDEIIIGLLNLLPNRNELARKARLWFARKLDDRYPQACWANLVVWAMGYDTNQDWDEQNCKTFAWCGKCRVLGRFKY